MAEEAPGVVTPVVPVAPAADAAPSPDPTAGQGVESPEKPEAPQERMLTQSEVNKLIMKREAIAEKRALRIAREESERHYQRLEKQRPPESQPQKQDGKPQWSQFAGKDGDVEQFLEALTDWKLESRTKETREQSGAQEQQRENRERAEFVQTSLLKPGAKKYGPEFESVVTNEDLPISNAMAGAIAQLENGIDVWYHLATHEDEAHRIAGLSDVKQLWEMRKLADTLAAPPKPTQTPPPIVPGGSRSGVSKDWNEMSTAEHAKAYHARKKR